jgi:hypothetical protein
MIPLLLAGAALAVSGVAAQQGSPRGLTKAQRTELVTLDGEVREAFGKVYAYRLPERNRKPPDANAPAFDWVKVLGLTPVHHQGGKPSCASQAAVAALEWNWQLRNGTRTKPVLSPQPIIDRLHNDNALRYSVVLDQLLLHGTTALVNYPYTGEPQMPRQKVRMPYRIIGWGPVGPTGRASVETIKEALLEHGPLLATVYTTPSFKSYKGGVFADHHPGIPANEPVNHAVVILGWDDRRGEGCWHIQNSWGPKWGEGGGMWIEYGCNNVGYWTFWLRAQSTHYNLPPDAHNLLGERADPFYRWPGAKDRNAAKRP